MEQLIAHLIGDYIFQADWMAQRKTKESWAALCHVLTYTLPFVALTQSWAALAVILVTHFFIDRFRLVRYLLWLKNFMAPRFTREESTATTFRWWFSWEECSATGYPPATPAWLATGLMIVADNALHMLINFLALKYL